MNIIWWLYLMVTTFIYHSGFSGHNATIKVNECEWVSEWVCKFMWFMRTQICIMAWVWHRYYKEKVIYEDIFIVPIIQNTYKSYRVSFFGENETYGESP